VGFTVYWDKMLAQCTICLRKKRANFETVCFEIIRIDYDDIWQKYSEYSRIEFACFSYRVGLLFLSTFRLSNRTPGTQPELTNFRILFSPIACDIVLIDYIVPVMPLYEINQLSFMLRSVSTISLNSMSVVDCLVYNERRSLGCDQVGCWK